MPRTLDVLMLPTRRRRGLAPSVQLSIWQDKTLTADEAACLLGWVSSFARKSLGPSGRRSGGLDSTMRKAHVDRLTLMREITAAVDRVDALDLEIARIRANTI